jgi:hypothetical protein
MQNRLNFNFFISSYLSFTQEFNKSTDITLCEKSFCASFKGIAI